jgi:hypothetical protein
MEESIKTEKKQPGLYSLTYDSWLLPDHGLSYQFRKVSQAIAAGKPAVTMSCNTEGNGQLETPLPPAIHHLGTGSTNEQVQVATSSRPEEPKDPK